MNKRMKKKTNLLRVYGREKIKKSARVKIYVKPENWSETVWLFGNAYVGDRYRMIHYGFRKEEAIRLLKTGYCSRDFEIDEGYVITSKNMVVLAVVNNFDSRLEITVNDQKKLCHVNGRLIDRTISLVTRMAIDESTDEINEPICIYDYLHKNSIKKYPDCIKPGYEVFICEDSGERTYVTKEEYDSLEYPMGYEDWDEIVRLYGKPYNLETIEYVPKDTKTIYGVYEVPYHHTYKNGLPRIKELAGIRYGKIKFVWEPTDIICTYYYADSKEEAMEEYNKTNPHGSGWVYNVAKVNKNVYRGLSKKVLKKLAMLSWEGNIIS